MTIEHWSAHRKRCIGITAHWFAKENRQNACIALQLGIGRCIYDALPQVIDGVIEEYGLEKKICLYTIDSGSNFVKASKISSVQIWIVQKMKMSII